MERLQNLLLKTKTDTVTGCLEWQGCLNSDGYGRTRLNKVHKSAHRAIWELSKGEIGDKRMLVCHKCDNRKCINLEHLFLGTAKENNTDCKQKGRLNNKREAGEIKHGTGHAYNVRRCRCVECKTWTRDKGRADFKENPDSSRKANKAWYLRNKQKLQSKIAI